VSTFSIQISFESKSYRDFLSPQGLSNSGFCQSWFLIVFGKKRTNAVDSTDLTGAYDHLVNLLANHLGLPNQRNDVLQRLKMSGPIGQEIYQTVERRDNSRDDYWQILQACLEHYDQDSLQVFRQVIATLLGTRTSARQLDQAFVALLDALADNGKANG